MPGSVGQQRGRSALLVDGCVRLVARIEEWVRRGQAGRAGRRAGLLGFVGRWGGVGRPGENCPRLGMGVML